MTEATELDTAIVAGARWVAACWTEPAAQPARTLAVRAEWPELAARLDALAAATTGITDPDPDV